MAGSGLLTVYSGENIQKFKIPLYIPENCEYQMMNYEGEAATAVFAICYQYLNLQSDIKTNSTAVVELQNQLNSLKAENNSHESEINAGIDYNAIYDTAVNELGMVYPSRSQVIGYDSKESEYVKQYKDISK